MTDLAERRDLEQVYQPAEDSRLLADTAAERVREGELVLDVGTGSGYAASVTADAGVDVVGVDVNPLACREARANGVPVVQANLTDPFRDAVFDLVVFNPPYLPTPPEDERDDWMEYALSGGEDGRAVIEPFLDDVERVLAPGGRVLLLLSTLTGLEAVVEYAGEQGLVAEEVAAEKHPFERLVVLSIAPADVADEPA
ncbi:HemK2/MTQ2 family protein methyltransferase [Halorientalis pallida]|uniref:Methyltransferase domain-containing protein n=1 Tax=Halorientalis pallida TaxID=2479928 RepID=A0A498KR02_9EURY|nr:HemK2/MTQ2 family protein methyltransferase [Halorientalis pallida]RXK46708.1 methyltransferase domain-containing protein [Halorientalis pallida]